MFATEIIYCLFILLWTSVDNYLELSCLFVRCTGIQHYM